VSEKKNNNLVCRGPNFGQGKCSKEFSITCWIWQANAILINLISIWSDSKLWLKRESDSSFLFENSNHVSNCKFDPLSNCSQLKFSLISIRNRIDQKQIKHVILNSFKYFWDKIWTPAYIKIIKILIYWLHITSIRIPGRYVFHRQFFVDEKKVIKLSMKKSNHEYFFHRQFFRVHRQILNFIDKYIFFSSTIVFFIDNSFFSSTNVILTLKVELP